MGCLGGVDGHFQLQVHGQGEADDIEARSWHGLEGWKGSVPTEGLAYVGGRAWYACSI